MSDRRQFATTDLRRQFHEVRRAATRAPVSVTHYDKEDLVILSADRFDDLLVALGRALEDSKSTEQALADEFGEVRMASLRELVKGAQR